MRHIICKGKEAFLSVIADAYEYEAALYSKARTSRLHIRVLEGEERPPCRRGTLYVKATRHRHLLLLPSLGEMTHRRMTPRRFRIRRVYIKARARERARGRGRRTSRRRYSSLKLVSRPSLSRLSRLSLARCGDRCPCPRERARKQFKDQMANKWR